MFGIFDSYEEKKLLDKLRIRWGELFDVHFGLPLRSVLGYETVERHQYKQYLHKTAFDFVLTTKDRATPLLIIEFDGIGGGFSNSSGYVPMREVSGDPSRKWKLDTKIDLCMQADIPFIVISFNELTGISGDDSLTVLDGIIGKVVADNRWEDIVEGRRPELDLRLSALSAAPSRELLNSIYEDFFTDCEILTENTYNPIAAAANELFNKHAYQGRLIAWHKLQPFECEEGSGWTVTGRVPGSSETISKSVALRAFNCKGASATSLAKDIAEYLLYKHIDEALSQ